MGELSTAGKRLQHADFGVGGDGIGQAEPIADEVAVDEDRHVLAQRGLIVEHVAAQARVGLEHRLERLAHRLPAGLDLGAVDVALQDVGEYDLAIGSDRKARAAAAGGGRVRVGDLERGADQVVDEVDLRAREVLQRHRVDQHARPRLFDDNVLGIGGRDESNRYWNPSSRRPRR